MICSPSLNNVAALPLENYFLVFSVWNAVFSGRVWVARKRAVFRCWDEDTDLEMDRVTADDWSDHHWQPHRQSSAWWDLPPPCWYYVLVAALSRWSAKRLSTHQSSRASAGVYGTFRPWRRKRDSPVDSNQESLWTRILLSEHGTVLHDARTLRNRSCVGWNSIIMWFQIYFNKTIGGKCINGCMKFKFYSFKNLRALVNYQQKLMDCFLTRPVYYSNRIAYCRRDLTLYAFLW